MSDVVDLEDFRQQREDARVFTLNEVEGVDALEMSVLRAAISLCHRANVLSREAQPGHANGVWVIPYEWRGLPDDELADKLLEAIGRSEGVPLVAPAAEGEAKRRGRAVEYPFATMEVGETFYVEKGPRQPKWNSFRVLVCHKAKKLNRKFLVHRYSDEKYAVWRQS